MKRITTTTAFVCLCTLLFAQNLQLRGRVVSGQESVEFANVILQTKDSAFIQTFSILLLYNSGQRVNFAV